MAETKEPDAGKEESARRPARGKDGQPRAIEPADAAHAGRKPGEGGADADDLAKGGF
jgi:hypothetical protein